MLGGCRNDNITRSICGHGTCISLFGNYTCCYGAFQFYLKHVHAGTYTHTNTHRHKCTTGLHLESGVFYTPVRKIELFVSSK